MKYRVITIKFEQPLLEAEERKLIAIGKGFKRTVIDAAQKWQEAIRKSDRATAFMDNIPLIGASTRSGKAVISGYLLKIANQPEKYFKMDKPEEMIYRLAYALDVSMIGKIGFNEYSLVEGELEKRIKGIKPCAITKSTEEDG